MASQSLYRKWRSQTFSDLIGQEAVTRTLLNAVREGRLAHAYLFCGPRGTGKTSAARLLAKAVNCANPHDGEPCNECVSCQEITTGRSPDVIEIDAASNTGVDHIRDLRESVNLMSSGGHYRVIVIDETHMLSTAAFNALLKTLEEPPPHVIFVLATTDAQKVLATVVSRCQRFDFHRIGVRDIVARLRQVAQGEGLTIEPAAADLLARAAQGGLRDALSLLDQAVAFCGAHVEYESTRQMLGLADVSALRALLGHVAAHRSAEGLDLINELVTTGADLRQLNQQIGEEWRALLLARAGGDVARLLDRTDEDAHDIVALAHHFTLEQLMACARIFTRNDGPARGLPVPQLALELSFLECVSACDPARPAQNTLPASIAPRAQPSHTQMAADPPAPPYTTIPPTRTPQTLQTAPATTARMASSAPAVPIAPEPAQNLTASADGDEWGDTREFIDEAEDAAEGFQPEAGEAPIPFRRALDAPVASVPAHPTDITAESNAFALSGEAREEARPGRDWLAEAQQQWALIKKICKQRPEPGSVVSALLNDAYPVLMEPGEPGDLPTLIVQAKHDFHARSLREAEKREVIEWALEQTLDTPIQVRIILEGAPGGPGVTLGANGR
ncbi:MAG TPA: DNA polymerase III subunit gamma/tau, partial [Ktedonobacterales bacterium]|nr:DNA polymerase III subunit gamma/tau [Ktedonobacterales bacterium]